MDRSGTRQAVAGDPRPRTRGPAGDGQGLREWRRARRGMRPAERRGLRRALLVRAVGTGEGGLKPMNDSSPARLRFEPVALVPRLGAEGYAPQDVRVRREW